MALKDKAVIIPATGYVFTNTVGAAAPTPAELDALDPERYGCQVIKITSTGGPDSFTLTVGGSPTSSLDAEATADQVQAALEALAAVGSGNVIVEGESITDADGFSVTVVGEKQGQTLTITGTGTGGTTPTIVVAVTTAPNGWNNLGHTSREDMPEFGFEGGESEVRGSWQRRRLREVQSGDPMADFLTLNLHQWDEDTMELYFGENASDTPGIFGVSGEFVPVEKSFLVILVDGPAKLGFYASKASIKREDSIELPVDEFSALPVRATFLNHGARRLYDWISLDLFPNA